MRACLTLYDSPLKRRSLPSALARRRRITKEEAVKNLASIFASQHIMHRAEAMWVFPLCEVLHNGNYAGERIMLRNGLPPQVMRSRQPRPFA